MINNLNDLKVGIFVVTHKEIKLTINRDYIPLQVGFEKSNLDLGYIKDNTKINISYKNSNYCELTALYWIWKNNQEFDYYGLFHYRRYLSVSILPWNYKKFITTNSIIKLLKKYDIIVPMKFEWDKNIVQIYKSGKGKEKDLKLVRDILLESYPDFIEAYDSYLAQDSGYYCNMFISNKDFLNSYCDWVFTILEKLETLIDLSQYDIEEARVFGYLSEILLNVWIIKNKLSKKELFLINTDLNYLNNLYIILKFKLVSFMKFISRKEKT